ncbi:MAG: hypothetical protein KAS75_08290 [Planctomycetes bacterium]|nr:hypothetical protein [Planctomycetota bacterium]
MNLKSISIAILLMLALTGCTKKNTVDPELDVIKAYAQAEVTIERLRKQPTPDWSAIKSQYIVTVPIVKKIDAKTGTNYNQEITDALKKCAAGERVKVNQQTLAKGLQHVTVLAITEELNKMANASVADRKMLVDRIAAYFEGIRPTFTRRDKDFFEAKKTLEAQAEAALERLAKAGSSDLITARRQLEDAINRTYALCVLFEIMEVEKLRDSDIPKCDVKRVEAVIFYRIIQPNIKKRSLKNDEIILHLLNGNYDTMSAMLLEMLLGKGLVGITLR